MPTAECIAIGTELLLGEINDTNTQYLARQLRDCGIDLFRSITIGDNLQRITAQMQESLSRADIVITTGGLGPTVDDPTRDAAALAFNTHNEFHPELWEQITQRFLKRAMHVSENNKKQAYIPAGAYVIENPVGTAPAFILNQDGKTLVCLPGVPREMEYLMGSSVIPWLKERYPLSGVIKARVLHVGAVSESKVDELVGDLEKMSNPTVGLLAHPGQVDIRITAKADSIAVADRMIADVESVVRQRLGSEVFGADGDTLCGAIQALVQKHRLSIKVITCGFTSVSFDELKHLLVDVQDGSSAQQDESSTENTTGRYSLFTFEYQNTPESGRLVLDHVHNHQHTPFTTAYAGAPGLREEWARNYCLHFMRRQLIQMIESEEKNDQS